MSIVKFFLRLAVGAGLLALLLHKHEVAFHDVWQRMKDIPLLFVLAALALDLGGQTLSAYRWQCLAALTGNRISFRHAWTIYFSGMFFNTCLPTTIGGDAVRVVGFSRHTGSKSVAFASVFMDRNVGMAALLALGLVSALLVPTTLQATFHAIRGAPLVLPLWPLFLLLGLGFVLANLVLFRGGLYGLAERLALRRLPEKARAKVAKLHDAVQAYNRPPGAYGWTFLLSLGYQASEAALVWVLALGLDLPLPFWVFGAMVMFQAVAGMLPITVNNIGVREGIFCAVLLGQAPRMGMAADAVKDEALALALLYLGIVVLSGVVGGIVYLAAGISRPAQAEVDD
jgi:hypothetical protein